MEANKIKVPSRPATTYFGFNIWLMNTETLFKRSGRPNILTFTSNSANKCTTKDHVVFTNVARVTTINTDVFVSPGNWKREGVNNSLRFLFFL